MGWCSPGDVVGEHVYFTRVDRANHTIDHPFRLDVASDHVIPASPEMYADDLKSHPRALVIGDSWQTGTPTDGTWLTFQVVGSRIRDKIKWQPVRALDAVGGAVLSGVAALLVAWALGVALS